MYIAGYFLNVSFKLHIGCSSIETIMFYLGFGLRLVEVGSEHAVDGRISMLVVVLASVYRMATVSPAVGMPSVVVIPPLYFVGVPRHVVVPMLVSFHVVHGGVGRGQLTTCATDRLFVTTGNDFLCNAVPRLVTV